jgi:glycerol-3-phosphate dehydrogenase subunit C
VSDFSLPADLCLKCNICTSACPVSAVTDKFPGPKAVGPQAIRFAHPDFPYPDPSVSWCSGCGVCSRVCPHNVPVAEINARAKARLEQTRMLALRDHAISRPDMLATIASPVWRAANFGLQSRPLRWLLEKTIGISKDAPLPEFQRPSLRQRQSQRCVESPTETTGDLSNKVALFHGCNGNHYEPELVELAISVLEYFGVEVLIPPQGCCGLPLQSNGLFNAATRYAEKNLKTLSPFSKAGVPIIGISTSCTLMLKHNYREILGLRSEAAELLSNTTFDIFEYLDRRHSEGLLGALRRGQPVKARTLYHPPCQLKAHGIGTPAVRYLQEVPDLQLHLSESECCGVAGTYGLKSEKYDVARSVGGTLFDQVREIHPHFILTDSETCRWWISKHTDLPSRHPIEVIAQALGIE